MPLTSIAASRFWQWIQPLDEQLLLLINKRWQHPWLDNLLIFTRETLFWYPLYFFLLLFMAFNFKAKGWWWVLCVILTASLADILSSQIIKEQIFRLRPCQDPKVAHQLHFFILYCPRSSSFTSSHATSHFAQAMFFFQTLRNVIPRAGLFFIWAFLIAYTQVYAGVHYPFDVFIGSLLGCGLGFLMARLYQKQFGMVSLAL